MSIVKIARRADIVPSYQDGLSKTPVLEGAYSQCAFNYCRLQAGASWAPRLYPFGEVCQVFLFIEGTGYIAGRMQAWNITETAVFVPDFDREPFTVHAGTDLTFIQILPQMSDYDRKDMAASCMALPRFRGLSQAWAYREDFKDTGVTALMLLEHRNLGRLSMGATLGKGPTFNGQHIHNELEQWYIALPGSSFTYTAGGETVQVQGGDITYTTHGNLHGSNAAEGQVMDYIWFELCENGYPGGIS